MSAQWKLDQQYAQIMENHPFGIALYRPLPRSTFSPGSCGYFDDFGAWNPIAHLEKDDVLQQKGLTLIEDELEKAPVEDGIIWGPKTSGGTKATKVELSGGIDPATGIPLTVSSVYNYSTDSDVGGVLLTSPPITHERYYHSSPFKKWIKQNALTILQRWPEVKQHGLWIVTSTFTTSKCAINMWNERGKGFKVGFSVEAMGFGSAGTSGEWYRSTTDEGWVEYGAKDGDRPVVFFGGLKFQYTWVFGKDLKPTARPVFRGDSEEVDEEPEIITSVRDPTSEEASYIVDCEEYFGEEDD